MVMAPIPSYWLLVEAVEHAQCQRIELVPSDMLSKALKYARKREANLRIYLDDPNVPIDTNHVERTLRCIPMGRNYESLVIM